MRTKRAHRQVLDKLYNKTSLVHIKSKEVCYKFCNLICFIRHNLPPGKNILSRQPPGVWGLITGVKASPIAFRPCGHWTYAVGPQT